MNTQLRDAHAEGHLIERLKFYTAPGLLIIDEIGHLPIDRLGDRPAAKTESKAIESARHSI